MGTNWQQVAYSNAYNAAKGGQPLDHAISNQPKYEAATRAAYAAYNATKRKSSSSSSSKSSSSSVTSTPAVAKATTTTTASTPKVADTPAPTLELPTLKLGDDASVVNQRDKILRYDSMPMQQARTQAAEQGTASGQIQSSQQEGAAMRALSSEATALGESEATLAAGEQMSNWTNKVTQLTTDYQNKYSERLAKLGYESDTAQLMATLNTSLSNSMLSSVTSLMNNTDLELEQGSMDRLLAIINSAQDNNNLALDMGFSY